MADVMITVSVPAASAVAAKAATSAPAPDASMGGSGAISGSALPAGPAAPAPVPDESMGAAGAPVRAAPVPDPEMAVGELAGTVTGDEPEPIPLEELNRIESDYRSS